MAIFLLASRTSIKSLRSAWKGKQAAWTNEKARYDGAVAEFKSFKASVDRRIKALEEEETALDLALLSSDATGI